MARPSKPLASVKQTKYSVAIAKTTFAGMIIPASSVSALFRHRTPMETSHNAVKNKVGSLCRLVLKGCTYFKGTNFKIMNIRTKGFWAAEEPSLLRRRRAARHACHPRETSRCASRKLLRLFDMQVQPAAQAAVYDHHSLPPTTADLDSIFADYERWSVFNRVISVNLMSADLI